MNRSGGGVFNMERSSEDECSMRELSPSNSHGTPAAIGGGGSSSCGSASQTLMNGGRASSSGGGVGLNPTAMDENSMACHLPPLQQQQQETMLTASLLQSAANSNITSTAASLLSSPVAAQLNNVVSSASSALISSGSLLPHHQHQAYASLGGMSALAMNSQQLSAESAWALQDCSAMNGACGGMLGTGNAAGMLSTGYPSLYNGCLPTTDSLSMGATVGSAAMYGMSSLNLANYPYTFPASVSCPSMSSIDFSSGSKGNNIVGTGLDQASALQTMCGGGSAYGSNGISSYDTAYNNYIQQFYNSGGYGGFYGAGSVAGSSAAGQNFSNS